MLEFLAPDVMYRTVVEAGYQCRIPINHEVDGYRVVNGLEQGLVIMDGKLLHLVSDQDTDNIEGLELQGFASPPVIVCKFRESASMVFCAHQEIYVVMWAYDIDTAPYSLKLAERHEVVFESIGALMEEDV